MKFFNSFIQIEIKINSQTIETILNSNSDLFHIRTFVSNVLTLENSWKPIEGRSEVIRVC